MPIPAILIEAGIASVGKLTGALADSVAFYDGAQKASLSLGMTFGDATDRLGNSMDGLRGTIATKLAGGFEILDAGFQENIVSMSYVTNQMKLTGQNTKKLLSFNQDLSFKLGLNSKEIGSLNVSMLETSRKYGLSMDTLVKSISGLKMEQLQAGGAKSSAALTKAVATMSSELGPQQKGMLTDFVNQLLKGDEQNAIRLQALGLTSTAEALFEKDMSPSEIVTLLTKAILTGEKAKSDFAFKGMGAFGRERGDQIFGKELTTVPSLLAKYFRENTRLISKGDVDAANTFSNLFAETFDIKRLFTPTAGAGVGMYGRDGRVRPGNTQSDSSVKTTMLNYTNANAQTPSLEASIDKKLTAIANNTGTSVDLSVTEAQRKSYDGVVKTLDALGEDVPNNVF